MSYQTFFLHKFVVRFHICKRKKKLESTKSNESQIINLGVSNMESNKYLEEFKIDIVHQYLQRRQKNLE